MTQNYPLEWPKGWPHTPSDKRRHVLPAAGRLLDGVEYSEFTEAK
jgi:hypothetical protein